MTRPGGPAGHVERTATVTSVTGGTHGLEAEYAALAGLAAAVEATAGRLLDLSATGARVAASPDLLAASALAPHRCARAEAAVLAATGALVPLAAEVEGAAEAMRASLGLLRGADAAAEAAVAGTLVAAVGAVAGAAAGLVGVGVARRLPPGLRQLGADAGAGLASRVDPGAWAARLDRGVAEALRDHPVAAQRLAASAPAAVDGLLGLPPGTHGSVGSLAADAGRLYPAEAVPRVARVETPVADGRAAPGSVAALIRQAHAVSRIADEPSGHGTIAIQRVLGPDGVRRAIVYLPGTDDLNPLSADRDVRDMATDLRLEAGRPTAYGAGVVAAMRDQGIGPDERVLLVGHSQGAMQAVALAGARTGLRITDVVAAGGPDVPVDLPGGVDVLSLEHQGDVVPLLDDGHRDDSRHHTTIRFDSGSTGLAGNHSYEHYEAGAAAADRSGDPSVRAAVGRLRPFLAGGEVSLQAYRISR